MKNITALVVAVILSVVGFAAMQLMMSGPGKAIEDAGPTTRILVARKDLKAGTQLEPAHLETKPVPTQYCTQLHVRESEKSSVLGRELRAAVKEGEPILALAVESGPVSAAVEVENLLRYPDTHAISVAVDAPGAVAGLLKPGQKVDVIGTFDVKQKFLVLGDEPGFDRDKEAAITRTVMMLQNRQVLAVDVKTQSRFRDARETGNHVVTIAVTAQEALKVAMLQAKGRPHLVLRARTDGGMVSLKAVGAETILAPAVGE